MPLPDYLTLMADMLRDDAGRISSDQFDRAISSAVSRYSQDLPRQVSADVVSTGASVLPKPTGWVDYESELVSLEYPVGEYPVSYIRPEYFGVVETPSGQEIRLVGNIQSGELVRVVMRVGHTLDASTDTLPAAHQEAVASYAASLLLDQIATLVADDQDSTIQADAVDHRSKSQGYAGRANKLRGRYYELLGIKPNRQVAASHTVNLDAQDSRGRDRLTHPRLFR